MVPVTLEWAHGQRMAYFNVRNYSRKIQVLEGLTVLSKSNSFEVALTLLAGGGEMGTLPHTIPVGGQATVRVIANPALAGEYSAICAFSFQNPRVALLTRSLKVTRLAERPGPAAREVDYGPESSFEDHKLRAGLLPSPLAAVLCCEIDVFPRDGAVEEALQELIGYPEKSLLPEDNKAFSRVVSRNISDWGSGVGPEPKHLSPLPRYRL